MFQKIHKVIKENVAFCILLAVSVILMLAGIFYVYHTKVLNAPKVYSDGFGYFAYLPALIRGDFSFSFIEAEGWEHPLKLVAVEGAMLNKYPVGVAVLEAPFFFAVHLLCVVKDALTGSFTATGYTNPYQYTALFTGVFYWGVGTVFLYRLLTKYFGFSKKVSVITCALMTYATNLFHYASYDACFSHVYSYMLFNAFLLYLYWYESREENKDSTSGSWSVKECLLVCVFGLLAGLIFMVRNTNVLFVLTYIFYGIYDRNTLKKRFFTVIAPKRAVPIIVTGVLAIMPQMAYWHTVTGKWFVYSYGENEPFYWGSPEIFNFLFSVRKGMFFWCPFLLLGVIGIFYARKKAKKYYLGLVSFLVVIIYLSSAWWCWYYGGSFGQRVAIDFFCVFAVFTAYILQYFEENKQAGTLSKAFRAKQIAVALFCVLCVAWNMLSMFSYWFHILPPDQADWTTIRQIFHL